MRIISIALLAMAVSLSATSAQQYQDQDSAYRNYLIRLYNGYQRQTWKPKELNSDISKPTVLGTKTRIGGVASRFGNTVTASQMVVPPKNDEQLARAVVDLALNIGRSLSEQSSAAEIFSPVSIMGVLNLLLLGAAGPTRTELLNALQLGDSTKISTYHRRASAMLNNLLATNPKELDKLAWKSASCVESDYSDEEISPPSAVSKDLRLATAIFTQSKLPLNDKTVTLASQLYAADTQSVNFRDSLAATAIINKWVAQATNYKIREIVSGSFPQDTNMVLVSSLYFKATWMTEFIAQSTRPKTFYPDGTDRPSFKVDTMTLTACLPYHFERDLAVRIIGLPYSDNATTMYVLMPQNSTRTKLRSLQDQLTAARLDTMLSKMQLRTTTLNFPRMQLESSSNLEKAFRHLGVKSIFSPQHSNLRLMLNQAVDQGQSPLYVSQVKHKVNLSVDEHGTEGAAVTMTLIDRAGSSVYFNVNQPFLIYVRHDPTRLPLFYGAVFDPRS